MNIYADSSFLVAVYLSDAHSPGALRRIAQRPQIWLTPFHKVEMMHAIAQNVYRGDLTGGAAERIRKGFVSDCESGVWSLTEMPPGVFESAAALALLHIPRIGGRTLDTLHVASALELKAQHFWTFDERQAKLAKAAGLKVS